MSGAEQGRKLGKTPARPGAVKLSFARYANTAVLPTPPAVFGHQAMVQNWGVLCNDRYGDCVWAGAAHETILWTDIAGATALFTVNAVLADYSAVTGFDPNTPSTDQGTDMEVAAKYRRKTGVVDAHGRRHKIGAYVALSPGIIAQLATAVYLFGAAGIGIEFPSSAMEQFDRGVPWDVVDGATIEGGHYVPVVGRAASGNFLVVTWGRLQEMTPAFYEKYCDEAVAYLSPEMLVAGKTPEGFDATQLTADLAALTGTPAPAPEPEPPAPVQDPVDKVIGFLRQSWPAFDAWLTRRGI